jgi:tRNA 2-thiouridine synthesizing protein E
LLISNDKTYEVDSLGFLLSYSQWDEDFAEALAASVDLPDGLSQRHWAVIYFIRAYYDRLGRCPMVYETGRANKLRLKDLEVLFPAGYLRGACKLAGITYRDGYVRHGRQRAVSTPEVLRSHVREFSNV